MEGKITKHMDSLFESAPKTRKAMELKEEMTQNTIEKYHDLLNEGYSQEDAFQNVIHSIGDVTELYGDLEEPGLFILSEADRRKKAMLTAAAMGLYVLVGVVFLGCETLTDLMHYPYDLTSLGLVLAGIICIFPTVMYVYAVNMYPSYHRQQQNLVESYKEAKYAGNQDKAVRASISVIIWTLTTALFFLVSFKTNDWYITWTIFLIGACVHAIVELIRSLKQTSGGSR